jgi:NADPH:quinone reductase-like Zn-dependent oxidoreductase
MIVFSQLSLLRFIQNSHPKRPTKYPHHLTHIQNEAIAIQSLDASILKFAYFPFPYPLIPGNNAAGIVVSIGSSVTKFAIGDRVISDTPMYVAKVNKYGAWQKYVVTKASTTCKVPTHESFEEAIVMPISLATAVAALSLKLGMPKPGAGGHEKVLIWGGSGSIGGNAVQYPKSVSLNPFTQCS